MKILTIPGDGVGQEVVPATVELLRELAPDLEIETEQAGYERWLRQGASMAPDLIERARETDGVLFGCTGTPAPPPDGYLSPILALRRGLGLSVNIRYCAGASTGMDLLLVRDCSEGLYVQRERAIPDGSVADHQVTRTATQKLARAAAALARRRHCTVTVVHKANVLKQTDGLFREVALEVLHAERVACDEALADAAGYHLVRDPGRYGILLMTSQVGDILSNVAAGVFGGIGLIPSLTLGDGPPLAEPIHGSAPDIAGRGIADPVATVLSAALLLEELGREAEAERLRAAVRAQIARRSAKNALSTERVVGEIRNHLTESWLAQTIPLSLG